MISQTGQYGLLEDDEPYLNRHCTTDAIKDATLQTKSTSTGDDNIPILSFFRIYLNFAIVSGSGIIKWL